MTPCLHLVSYLPRYDKEESVTHASLLSGCRVTTMDLTLLADRERSHRTMSQSVPSMYCIILHHYCTIHVFPLSTNSIDTSSVPIYMHPPYINPLARS